MAVNRPPVIEPQASEQRQPLDVTPSRVAARGRLARVGLRGSKGKLPPVWTVLTLLAALAYLVALCWAAVVWS